LMFTPLLEKLDADDAIAALVSDVSDINLAALLVKLDADEAIRQAEAELMFDPLIAKLDADDAITTLASDVEKPLKDLASMVLPKQIVDVGFDVAKLALPKADILGKVDFPKVPELKLPDAVQNVAQKIGAIDALKPVTQLVEREVLEKLPALKPVSQIVKRLFDSDGTDKVPDTTQKVSSTAASNNADETLNSVIDIAANIGSVLMPQFAAPLQAAATIANSVTPMLTGAAPEVATSVTENTSIAGDTFVSGNTGRIIIQIIEAKPGMVRTNDFIKTVSKVEQSLSGTNSLGLGVVG
ncbi:MAG: hypothetical protein ACRCZ9_02545, partial [Fusobacteriaceae bacterium]